MSFINFPDPTPVFPTLPPQGWSKFKKPIMASSVTTAVTGRECQLARAVYPRWAFTLKFGDSSWLRDETQNIVPDSALAGYTELEQILGLFLQCRGAYGEFYFDDPEDNSRSNQNIGTQDNSVVVNYPMFVPWGNGPFVPSLLLPCLGLNAISQVSVGGNILAPDHYAIAGPDRTSVTINSGSFTGTVLISYSFYFRCRFLDDNLTFSQWAKNLWENKEIRFESVKP